MTAEARRQAPSSLAEDFCSERPTHPDRLASCLPPLLDALGWHGDRSIIIEALPHFTESLGLDEFLNVMARLRFRAKTSELALDRLDGRLTPCLFVPRAGDPMVVFKIQPDAALVFDSADCAHKEIPLGGPAGTAAFFLTDEAGESQLQKPRPNWFRTALAGFHRLIGQGFMLSFFLFLLAAATPLFVMLIYDQIPFFENSRTLGYIVAGVSVFVISEFAMRLVRSRLLGFLGARLSYIVGTEVFRRIVYLPSAYTESASIGAQLARIKDFESAKSFLAGQAMNSLLEMPMVVVLIIALALVDGIVVLVPLVAIAVFVVLTLVMLPVVGRLNEISAQAGSRRQEIVIEMLSKLRHIRFSGADEAWRRRYRDLSADTSHGAYRNAQINSLITVTTNFLVMAAGAITMLVGVTRVMANEMTPGALMAAMLFSWRILAPLRDGFMVVMQIGRVRRSVSQLDRLMLLDIESRASAFRGQARQLKGQVEFRQVSLRYFPESQPALLSLDFEARPGETVAITGHDGAGKSTLLKLILGMYKPQAGHIVLDGIPLRQFDPFVLRQSIGYAPQEHQLFHGTIEQNLRLGHPAASRERIETVCGMVGLADEIGSLPEGLLTRLGDQRIKQLPDSFTWRMILARALIRPTQLLLLDEPTRRDDPESVRRFLELLALLQKQEITILMATRHASYIQAAHKVLWLDGGRRKFFGPTTEALPRMNREWRS